MKLRHSIAIEAAAAVALLGVAALAEDSVFGNVQRWRSTGQASAKDIPYDRTIYPNATVRNTATVTETDTGSITTTTTSGALGTATATITRVVRSQTVPLTAICTTTPASGAIACAETDGRFAAGWAPPVVTVWPAGVTKTSWATATNTITNTDVATTTPAAGAIPMAGTDAQISSGWLSTTLANYVQSTGGSATFGDSVVPLDVHDVAMFKFAEAYGTTSLVNSVATGTNTSTDTLSSSNALYVYPRSSGLREEYSLRITNVAHYARSGYTQWENSQISVAGWFFFTAAPAASSYLWYKAAKQNSYASPYLALALYVNANSQLQALIVTTASSPSPVSTGTSIHINTLSLYTWHYLAVTWDTNYLSLYINGVLQGQSANQSGATISYDAHGEWRIGGIGAGGAGQGQLYNVASFNITDNARSTTELLTRFRLGASMTGKGFSW